MPGLQYMAGIYALPCSVQIEFRIGVAVRACRLRSLAFAGQGDEVTKCQNWNSTSHSTIPNPR